MSETRKLFESFQRNLMEADENIYKEEINKLANQLNKVVKKAEMREISDSYSDDEVYYIKLDNKEEVDNCKEILKSMGYINNNLNTIQTNNYGTYYIKEIDKHHKIHFDIIDNYIVIVN